MFWNIKACSIARAYPRTKSSVDGKKQGNICKNAQLSHVISLFLGDVRLSTKLYFIFIKFSDYY